MNVFAELERGVTLGLANQSDCEVIVDRPARSKGRHFLTVRCADGFLAEVEWDRHLGFGLTAGWNLEFGTGVDEILALPTTAVDRVLSLVRKREATAPDRPVKLAELRKMRGVLQKDAAERLNITKGGLAQLEKPGALSSMQVGTLQRFAAGVGGTLIVSVRFPEGRERTLAV